MQKPSFQTARFVSIKPRKSPYRLANLETFKTTGPHNHNDGRILFDFFIIKANKIPVNSKDLQRGRLEDYLCLKWNR